MTKAKEASISEMASKFMKLEKFEGQDFRRWQKKMHFMLTSLKVAYVISTPCPEVPPPIPDVVEDETAEETAERNAITLQHRRFAKWENDDYICRGHILNGMADSLFDVYQNYESSRILWEALEAKYLAEDASSKKFLVSNFNNFKMSESRPVMDQYHDLLRVLGQLNQHGITLDENFAVSSIIDKLPLSWKEAKHLLKHSKEEMNLVQLGSHLRIEEEFKMNEKGKKSEDKSAHSVNTMEAGKGKGGKRVKKRKRFGEPKPTASKKPKIKGDCWKCGKPGHMKMDCKSKIRDKDKGASTPASGSGGHAGQGSPLIYGLQRDDSIFSISNIDQCLVLKDENMNWWLDSGATTHVCMDKKWFKHMRNVEDGLVLYMGNESTTPVLGKGDVHLHFTSGKELILHNVLYAPSIRKNVVSGGVLNKLGYRLVFEADRLVISRAGTFVGFGHYKNNMFLLNVINNNKGMFDYMVVSSTTSCDLLHARLGHLHLKRMMDMAKDKLIPDFVATSEKCKTCMLTKITRLPFKAIKREEGVLGLVHSDLGDLHATPSLGNKRYYVTFIEDHSRYCYLYLVHSKNEALEMFKAYKTEVELQTGYKIKRLRTDRGGEYMDEEYFRSCGIIHERTAPYTPQQNGVAERKNRVLKDMVNAMLSYSGLKSSFWGEAILTANYILNRVPSKRSRQSPYELWFKRKPSLDHLRVWGCRAVVRLTEPKRKTLGDKGVECIFIGYAHNSTAYRFFVIEPNHAISVNTVIESRDAIFDETRFTSSPRPREVDREEVDPSSEPMETEEEPTTALGSVLGRRVTRSMARAGAPIMPMLGASAPREGTSGKDATGVGAKTVWGKESVHKHKAFDTAMEEGTSHNNSGKFGHTMPLGASDDEESSYSSKNSHSALVIDRISHEPIFQVFLMEGSREEEGQVISYLHMDEDPKTFEEAMKSHDVSFWKEAIQDEMDSIVGNNTWELADLPPGCKPLGCKWIFKRKMKTDGSIDKYKARLVIQGFRQREGVDYFDTYAPVARITTIKLLIALASIHGLVIHQMDVKTAFLNGELDEEVYMKQPEGFVVDGQEHKVCRLVKSLYGLKQAPKQWHQKFDDVVLKDGFKINQADKCVYSKFDRSGQGVMICLYVDDMLIFGTNQEVVDKTKEFLSTKFSMKDLGEADVILGIKIKRDGKALTLTQSHYVEKVVKRFNADKSTPVSTPMEVGEKLLPNSGDPISQLEYSQVIGCLMYAMTCTRPDIAFAVGRLSRFTSRPSKCHWKALRRVLRYLYGTMTYGITYVGTPSSLEGYTDASWITNLEDHTSTSGWVFLLGGGAISWASKKQSCITTSTMESEFVALAAAGKEAEWLRNLVIEIPLWPKPVSPIAIFCDSQSTLAKAYSQVYNGKSRHLGVRHSSVRELITHRVVSVVYVRTHNNLADHLTKSLARDLVLRSAEGVGLKSYLRPVG